MLSSSTLKMEAACSSTILAVTCKTMVSYNPENYNPKTYHCGNPINLINEIFINSLQSCFFVMIMTSVQLSCLLA
jgi:hypothetical protein